MDFRAIKEDLACPACKNRQLKFSEAEVFCPSCTRRYPTIVKDGQQIVNFIPDANARYMNPVQRLWWYLLEISSKEKMEKIEGKFEKHPFHISDEEFARVRIEGKRVLDIGGHSGALRKYLSPDQQYICVEPDTYAYERRHRIGLVDPRFDEEYIFIQGAGEYLPFREGIFDSILMYSVIEHFFDLNFALGEAHRVLGRGGQLVISANLQGVGARGKNRNKIRKVIDYAKKNGIFATPKRIYGRVLFNVKRRVNPWRHVLDFSQAQLESGHIYDDLKEDDVKQLCASFGFVFKELVRVQDHSTLVFQKQ